MRIYIAGDCDMAPEARPGLWALFNMDRGCSVEDLTDAMDDLDYEWVTTPPPADAEYQPAWFVWNIRKSTILSALAKGETLVIDRLGD